MTDDTAPQEQPATEDIQPLSFNNRFWYTVKQAALVLGTSEKYVRTLATHKDYRVLTYYKFSERNMVVLKDDVDAYKVNQGKPGRRTKGGQPGQQRKTNKQQPRGGYGVSLHSEAQPNVVTLASIRH